MSFGSDSSSGGQQVDPALQRFIAEETEKQKMQVMEENTLGRDLFYFYLWQSCLDQWIIVVLLLLCENIITMDLEAKEM